MPFNFRPNTTDQEIFEDVAVANCYRLPKHFSKDDVLIDIGAHVGSFSYAALSRGAGLVVACEVDPENAAALRTNLSEFIDNGRLIVKNIAISRSDLKEQTVYLGEYSGDEEIKNTGGLGVIFPQSGQSMPAIGLDALLDEIKPRLHNKGVRLLKLDCEGSEWPILMTSKRLHLIQEMCGEFHELGGKYNDEIPPFSFGGLKEFTATTLKRELRKAGFSSACHRIRGNNRQLTCCGLFFASRAPVFSKRFARHLLRHNVMLGAKLRYDDLRGR
jgi:FkbM family methyltransferase